MKYDYDITYDIYMFMFYINKSYFLHIYIYTVPPKKKIYLFHGQRGYHIYIYIYIYVIGHQKKQYYRSLANVKNAKIKKNSRKPKNKKIKPIFQNSCKSKKIQKSKKPRENPKKKQKKNKKKQYSRSLEMGSTGKSSGILFFWFYCFFWFSRGFFDF